MPRYARAHVPGGKFFFTVALEDRRRTWLVDHHAVLRQSFHVVRRSLPFRTDAIVLLPEHLHCIWTLPPGDTDFSTRWRLIKSHFSRGLAPGERLTRRRIAKRERAVWQRRFWEHVIRGENDLAVHLDYIHYNPVKHGHAPSSADWPYSSFHRYVKAGVYPQDWGAGPSVRALEME